MWLVESVYITLYVSLWADVVAHSGYPTFLLQENKMISRDRVLRSLKIIRMSRFWDNLMILREINILQKNKVGCPKLATLVQCFLSHNFQSYFPKRFDYLVHNQNHVDKSPKCKHSFRCRILSNCSLWLHSLIIPTPSPFLMFSRWPEATLCTQHGRTIPRGHLGTRNRATESHAANILWHDGMWTEGEGQLQTGRSARVGGTGEGL